MTREPFGPLPGILELLVLRILGNGSHGQRARNHVLTVWGRRALSVEEERWARWVTAADRPVRHSEG